MHFKEESFSKILATSNDFTMESVSLSIVFFVCL